MPPSFEVEERPGIYLSPFKNTSKLPSELYSFWHGPDPIETSKRVCETHLPPVLMPWWIKSFFEDLAKLKIRMNETNFEKAERLVNAYDAIGMGVSMPSGFKNFCGKERRPYYIVMRKELLAMGKPAAVQLACVESVKAAVYEEMPLIIMVPKIRTRV